MPEPKIVTTMVPIVAVLRDTRNGRVHRHEYEVPAKYAENQLFGWTEHNNACDCNRSLRMYSPGGELECNPGPGTNVIELLELWINGEQIECEMPKP